MVLGLGITNKMARLWPGAPTAFAIHEYVSLLGLVLMGDHFVDFSLPLTDMAKVTETTEAPVENPYQDSQALEATATEATPIKLEDPSVIQVPEQAVISEKTSDENKVSERAFKELVPEAKYQATCTSILRLKKNDGETEPRPPESHEHTNRVHIFDK